VPIGVLDSLLVRPARGATAAARTPGRRRRCRRVSGWPMSAGLTADAVTAADDDGIGDAAPA